MTGLVVNMVVEGEMAVSFTVGGEGSLQGESVFIWRQKGCIRWWWGGGDPLGQTLARAVVARVLVVTVSKWDGSWWQGQNGGRARCNFQAAVCRYRWPPLQWKGEG